MKGSQSSEIQKDLGVLIHDVQMASMLVQQVIRKANTRLFFVAKKMYYRSRKIMLQLYFDKLHMYCIQFWSSI